MWVNAGMGNATVNQAFGEKHVLTLITILFQSNLASSQSNTGSGAVKLFTLMENTTCSLLYFLEISPLTTTD